MSGSRAMSLLRGRDSRRWRQLATPEGVPLAVRIGDVGKRVRALMFDAFIIYSVLFTCHVVFIDILLRSQPGMSTAFYQIAQFLLLNFYFVFFELRWQGATPGKRVVGLRVVDRSGAPLTAEAVVARNLVRDIELIIPLVILVSPESFWPGAPKAASAIASIWAVMCAFLPVLNRDHLRIGDLVAGTMVIDEPKELLLPDVTEAPAAEPVPVDPYTGIAPVAPAAPHYTFTEAQLDVYGIYELQVLERVLREQAQKPEAVSLVCGKVMAKIGWPADQWNVDPIRFLTDFYRAMRAHLEHEMLFGKRRENKYDTTTE